MTNDRKTIKEELNKCADPEKAAFLLRYFKVFPGGYGEGDSFIGVKAEREIFKRAPVIIGK